MGKVGIKECSANSLGLEELMYRMSWALFVVVTRHPVAKWCLEQRDWNTFHEGILCG